MIYSPIHEKHNPSKYIWHGKVVNYIESPERVYSILKELESGSMTRTAVCIEHPEDDIMLAHDARMIDFIKRNRKGIIRYEEFPDIVLDCDEALSFSPMSYPAIISSADCALSGAELIISGKSNKVYSLCRPPGHHATKTKMGGFCFLNNAAIATKKLLESGSVAVLDIDRHHGNGTQDILYEEMDALYVSLNADRVYPGILDERQSPTTSTGNTSNFTVNPRVTDDEYLRIIDSAIEVIKARKADVLVVSAGFDTSENEFADLDDVETVKLTRGCFHSMGRKIREMGISVLVVQEGGYNTESLGKDVAAFLDGLK